MSELVFWLEEPSAKAMLEGLIPRIAPGVLFRCFPFEGKQDLERQLEKRLRGYNVPNARFVVLRDQDAEDCLQVKARLSAICKMAGKPATLVRIACRELESWYLADLQAAEHGFGLKKLATKQNVAKYRNPDRLSDAAEEFLRLTGMKYQKIAGSRAIGPHLDPANTRSTSFKHFVLGLYRLLAEPIIEQESIQEVEL